MSRVLVFGGTGVLGSAAVPRLREAGHEVVTASRREAPGEHVAVDALDGAAVAEAVAHVAPDVVVNALTALPPGGPRGAKDLEATSKLRIEGTDNLVATGVRLVSESFLLAGVDGGGDAGDALRHLERVTLGAGGVVLRFGMFYGPGSRVSEEQAKALTERKLPLVGGSSSMFSFVHVRDAGSAVVAAVERGEPGALYDVADDEPVAFGEFLSEFASVIGAPAPRRIPALPVRIAMPFAAWFMTKVHAPQDNAKLRGLGWAPEYPTYRDGLRTLAAAG